MPRRLNRRHRASALPARGTPSSAGPDSRCSSYAAARTDARHSLARPAKRPWSSASSSVTGSRCLAQLDRLNVVAEAESYSSQIDETDDSGSHPWHHPLRGVAWPRRNRRERTRRQPRRGPAPRKSLTPPSRGYVLPGPSPTRRRESSYGRAREQAVSAGRLRGVQKRRRRGRDAQHRRLDRVHGTRRQRADPGLQRQAGGRRAVGELHEQGLPHRAARLRRRGRQGHRPHHGPPRGAK